jgi:fucose permease
MTARPSTPPVATRELRRARVAVLSFFFLLGAVAAIWSARLPTIKDALHLSDGRLGLAGAAIGGLSAWLGAAPLPTFAAVGAALIAGGLFAGPHMVIPPPAPQAGHPDDAPRRSPGQISMVIWVLGLLALCGQVGEGSAGDWSAVYLHVNLGTSAGVAATGLAAFSGAMAAGRMMDDRLAARVGSVALVRASGLLAGVGLGAGLLIRTPAAAVAGFALLGAGLAGIFPQIVSSAVRLDPSRAGRNIGRIAAVAYSGLLGGPVAIGAAASGVGLRDALLIPASLALLVAATASVMTPHQPSRNKPSKT